MLFLRLLHLAIHSEVSVLNFGVLFGVVQDNFLVITYQLNLFVIQIFFELFWVGIAREPFSATGTRLEKIMKTTFLI